MASPLFTSFAQSDRDKALEKFVWEFRNTLGGFQRVNGAEERQKLAFFNRDLPGRRHRPLVRSGRRGKRRIAA